MFFYFGNAFIFVTYFSYALGINIMGCETDGPCKFHFLDDFSLDLSGLKPTNGLFITYMNTSAGYFYHPCGDVPVNSSNPKEQKGALWLFSAKVPSNVTLNAKDVLDGKIDGEFIFLASADTVTCSSNEKNRLRTSLIYHHEDITSEILLLCDDSATARLELESSMEKSHILELIGADACMKIASPVRHLSGGSVFTIIFFTFAFFYLLIGALIMKFLRGAQGLEMIPQLEFWMELPALIRDGIRFACSCCKIRGIPLHYESI